MNMLPRHRLVWAVIGFGSAGLLTAGLLAGTAGAWADASANVVTISMPGPENPVISSFDPAEWGSQILLDQGTILEGLAGYNSRNQIVPKIATRWTSSDGGTLWTFYLRHNARWSNGKPVTAEDFKYAWLREAAPTDTAAALWAGIDNYILNVYNYHAGSVPASAVGIKVVNPYELQVRLTAPHDIVGELPLSASMPLYPPDVEAHPTTWFLPQYFVGDGPYVISKFVEDGQIILTRNKDYVGAKGEVNVGNVAEIDISPTTTVPVENYEAGTIDIAAINNPADYKYAEEHLKSQLHQTPVGEVNYLAFDKSVVKSPVDNPLVREAVAMAIDRSPIVRSGLSGMGGVTTVMGIPGWPTDRLEHDLPYNVKAARKLLAKAGYPNGKGIGTLYLYCQTEANSPASVITAETIQSELKTNLNLNFKIEPTNSTLWGDITWGGLNKGILPGFNVSEGVINWDDSTNLPFQADQWVGAYGTIGSPAFMSHAEDWYFPTYDTRDIAMWGNPDNTKLGVTMASWAPLLKSAHADIAYLARWMAKQPAAYRADLTPPGTPTNSTLLNDYLNEWKAAKTPAAKHQVWVSAWEWVGNYAGTDGGTNLGLNGQVYVHQHESHTLYLWNMWETELEYTIAPSTQYQLTAKLVNGLMQQGYVTPLYYSVTPYLSKPDITGIQPNPFSYFDFYQLQYLRVK